MPESNLEERTVTLPLKKVMFYKVGQRPQEIMDIDVSTSEGFTRMKELVMQALRIGTVAQREQPLTYWQPEMFVYNEGNVTKGIGLREYQEKGAPTELPFVYA